MKKAAVVFDMDGVIFDSEKLYRKHWMITGEEYGIAKEEMENICNLIAGATRDRNEKLMKELYGPDFDYDSFRSATMNRMDEEIKENGLELKPGVLELFAYLKENGYKIGLATSTYQDRAEGNLKRAGIYDFFDYRMYGGIVEHGKPAPDIYLHACEGLGVAPEDAIGIEDSINGVKSCAAAGLYTIMVVDLIQPTQEIQPMTKHIFHSLLDVKRLLEGHN